MSVREHSRRAVVILCYFFTALSAKNLPPSANFEGRPDNRCEYDFVIVGGGSAGSVVANRLSANSNISVLLIEAGYAEDETTLVPLLAPLQLFGRYSWPSKTEPQGHACFAYEGNRCLIVRGRALGGGSVINHLLLARGNRNDYDSWAANGAEGWAYEDVLPYFKSIERFNIPEFFDKEYHSMAGEIPESLAPWHSELSKAFLRGMNDMGYKIVDYNGAGQIGHSFSHYNTEKNQRVSAGKAFIQSVISERANLKIVLGGVATKIEFNGLTAVGVHYRNESGSFFAKAKREVVVSAGAIGSPQLLMLSGIGPKSELDHLQIKTVAHLPVGENLQDHFAVGGIAATMDKNAGINASDPRIILDYELFGTGPMTIAAGIENMAFLNTSNASTRTNYPDGQAVLVSLSPSTAGSSTAYKSFGLKEEVYKKYFMPNSDKYAFMIVPLVLRPHSRGTVKLNRTKPFDYPIVDPQYLSHPDDIRTAVRVTKEAMRVLDTAPMRALGVRPWDILLPGCEHTKLWSDDYMACLAKHMTQAGWHYSSTCPMGNDTNAVVDARLRVRGGVRNLRVVDCSIMPTIVSGNTNFPAMMIGAKGAAMILQDHGISTDRKEEYF